MKFGISFTTTHLNQAGALVHVYTDGSVHLNHGGTEMGQGLFIKVAQVVAEEFQIDLDRVKITATTHRQGAQHLGHRRLLRLRPERHGGAATPRRRSSERLDAFAAKKYKVPEEQVVFLPNRVRVGNDEMAFAELVAQAYLGRVSLSATGFYATPEDPLRPRHGHAAGRSSISPMARRSARS